MVARVLEQEEEAKDTLLRERAGDYERAMEELHALEMMNAKLDDVRMRADTSQRFYEHLGVVGGGEAECPGPRYFNGWLRVSAALSPVQPEAHAIM